MALGLGGGAPYTAPSGRKLVIKSVDQGGIGFSNAIEVWIDGALKIETGSNGRDLGIGVLVEPGAVVEVKGGASQAAAFALGFLIDA
jgi:hypothetical protein